jgi:hypothetical protein
MLFVGSAVAGGEFSASALPQGDWYSRGIVRGQTIKVIAARQKRQQYHQRKHRQRKKRKAHAKLTPPSDQRSDASSLSRTLAE